MKGSAFQHFGPDFIKDLLAGSRWKQINSQT
jgi:hypothetical protein